MNINAPTDFEGNLNEGGYIEVSTIPSTLDVWMLPHYFRGS